MRHESWMERIYENTTQAPRNLYFPIGAKQ